MGRLRIVGSTRHPRAEVVRLIRFAYEGKVTGDILVNLKACRGVFAGRAYKLVPMCSPLSRDPEVRNHHFVILRIGPAEKFPWARAAPYRGLKGAPLYELRDWREAVVQVAAHEFQHCQQHHFNVPRSEVEAEMAGARALERYRASLLAATAAE